MKNRQYYNILILLGLLLLSINQLFAAKREYQNLTQKQIHELIPSSTRFIQSLSGKWLMSYDEKEWQNVKVPYSTANNETIFFKRIIKIDKSIINNYTWQLLFFGVDDEIEIYINEQFIGKYFGALSSFYVRIPYKLLRNGANTLKLKIKPAEYGSKQVKEQNIFMKKVFTGIIREVFLVGTPQIWIKNISYSLKFSSGFAKCKVKSYVNVSSSLINRLNGNYTDSTNIYNQNKITVTITPKIIRKKTGEIVAEGSYKYLTLSKERTADLKFNLTVLNPILWSISNPELYQLVYQIKKGDVLIDELACDMGFREIKTASFKGKNVFIVNGKLFDIKGVDYIEDYYQTNPHLDYRRFEKDINNMKTLGANVVRYKYTLPNPIFVKLCNKHGLFVLVDFPLYDVPVTLIKSNEIKVRMKNIADRVVSGFGNDPSVIAWGIYEGVQENTKEVIGFDKFILPKLRNASTNLIYKSVLLSSPTVNTNGYDFIVLRQIGRKISYNKIKTNLTGLIAQIKSKPVIFNYGMIIQPDNHNGYSDPFSIESQSNYIFNLFYLAKSSNMAGSIIWSYNDYMLNNPLLIVNNNNKYICTSGLFNIFRQQRLAYSDLQALFNNEKDPLFYAGSNTQSTPISFIIYALVIGIILIFLINRFKRFREYFFRSLLRPYNFYADIRDQRIMSTVQTYILGLVISLTFGIILSTILYFYRTSTVAQYILMFIFPFKDVQEILFKLIWEPYLLVSVLGILFFIKIFIISFIIKLSSLFVRSKIFFNDSFTIAIWSGTPILILLPISLFLYKLLVVMPSSMWVIFAIAVLLFLWVFFRLLRAISVVFDVQSVRVYIIGIISSGLFATLVISFFQVKLSIFSYAQYLCNVLLKI